MAQITDIIKYEGDKAMVFSITQTYTNTSTVKC